MKRSNVKRLTFCALLTAIALTIFMVEAQLPPVLTFFPGMKLGLANIVTVYAMFALGPADTFLILIARITLGSLFSGGSTFLFSLGGGLLCYVSMLFLRKLLSVKQLWACGAVAAIFHNIGQCTVAVLWYRASQLIAFYFPYVMLAGILAGLFTGLAAQFLLARIGDKIDLN